MYKLMIAVSLALTSGEMRCPGSPAFALHSGMRVTATSSASCDDIRDEALARVNGQYGKWYDPHNNGTYTRLALGGDLSFQRVTGDGMFTDNMIFSLSVLGSPAGETGCLIEACSESQGTSGGDFGTNYCNLKMLYCGSNDGCSPLLHDFECFDETTRKMALAEADMAKCLVLVKTASARDSSFAWISFIILALSSCICVLMGCLAVARRTLSNAGEPIPEEALETSLQPLS